MKNITYYRSMPDYIELEQLEKEFDSLFETSDMANKIEFLDALSELSFRKENIDMEINEDLRNKANKSVIDFWDCDSLANTEICIMIIFNLELEDAFIYMKKKCSIINNSEVLAEIKDAINDAKNSPPPVKYW